MAVVLCPTLPATAGTTDVQINNGEVITQEDLDAGMFMDQVFLVGPDTVFEINEGGALAPLGMSQSFPFPSSTPYDLMGATINVNSGGVMQTNGRSLVGNAVINLLPGGIAQNGVGMSADSIFRNLGGDMDRFSMSQGFFEMSDGTISDLLTVFDGGTADVSGGTLDEAVITGKGSSIKVSGGHFGGPIDATDGARVVFTGGMIDDIVRATDGVKVDLSGSDIRRGIYLERGSDLDFTGGTATRIVSEDGTLDISGGDLFGSFTMIRGDVMMSGGRILNGTPGPTGPPTSSVLSGSFTMTGGIAEAPMFYSRVSSSSEGTTADIFDGELSGRQVLQHATMTIHGGYVTSDFRLNPLADLRIHGGNVTSNFNLQPHSELQLEVRRLWLDGERIDLEFGESLVLEQRDATLLEALLTDGSFFDLVLTDSTSSGDFISSQAEVVAVFVPSAPTAGLFGVVCGAATLRRRRS